MNPLRQRILRRAIPAGIASALLGLLLLYVYVPVAQLAAPDMNVEVGNTARGVAVFGLIGFAITAAMECVRQVRVR